MIRADIDSRSTSGTAPDAARYRRYVLGLLLVVYVFNFIDRQILSILLQPIKQDLQVSDTAMGFLTGIAFALFYSVAGIPIARWADTGSRTTIIAIGLFLWSGMTAASGLARTFVQLAAARIGVAVGEAAGTPPAHSLISEYFPPERRATALAVYSMGIPIGVLFGFLLGGWINEYFGWRRAFFVVGLPGVVLAILVQLTLRDPRRDREVERAPQSPGAAHATAEASTSAGAAPEPPPGETASSVLRFLWESRSFRHLSIGAGLQAFVGYGSTGWAPTYMIRVHGMGTGEVGTWLGLIAGFAGGAGTLAGGILADRLARRDVRWNLRIPALALLVSIPFSLAFFLWPEPRTALLFCIPSVFLGQVWLGPTMATAQGLALPQMRAMASAILLFIINLIGLGLGPQAVGILSDLLTPAAGPNAIRYALAALSLIALWASLQYLLATRTLVADLERTRGLP